GGASLPSLTSGVSPIVSSMLLKRAMRVSSKGLRVEEHPGGGAWQRPWKRAWFFGPERWIPGAGSSGIYASSRAHDRLVPWRSGTTIPVMAALELKFLGGLEILRDGASIELPPSKKTRALLA